MRQPPRPPAEAIFTARSRLALGVAAAALTGTALAVGALAPGAVADRRTAVFLALGLGQLGVALALRSARGRRRGTRGLEKGAALAGGLLLLAVYAPILSGLLDTVPPPAPVLGTLVAVATLPGILVRLVVARET
jgi:Ca2+-transporting ATPase